MYADIYMYVCVCVCMYLYIYIDIYTHTYVIRSSCSLHSKIFKGVEHGGWRKYSPRTGRS